MDKEKNQEREKDQNRDIKTSNEANLSKNQVIFYSLILAGTISIFILSMIGINPFILLIIIGIVIIYVYFDKDIQNTDAPNDNREIKTE